MTCHIILNFNFNLTQTRYYKPDEWGKISGVRSTHFSRGPRFIGDADTMVKKRGHQPGPGHYENKKVFTIYYENKKVFTYENKKVFTV